MSNPRHLPGDDVIVTFEDREARGVVLTHLRGYVMATIEIDPEYDYGSITARMAPHSTVCVREGDVRLATPLTDPSLSEPA